MSASVYDAAVERLTGATVLEAIREYPWLTLHTTKGSVSVAGGRVRLDLTCPKCQEPRLVEVVTDKRVEQGFCAVCSHSWGLEAVKR